MGMFSNRFWFKLHGWFSLPVWMIFCFVCLTGTIAVLSHEITWLTNSASRASNPENLPKRSIPELVDIVQQEFPTASITTVMTFEPYMVYGVVFTDSDKPYAVAYVNQYTGKIQEVNNGITFVGFMRSLHGWLLFPWQNSYSLGYYLVCSMALVMLGALVTGLMVYKNFWKAFTQPKLRAGQGKQTFLADLHRLSGIWSIWFLMIMSATGGWYFAQSIMWHIDYELEPHPSIVSINALPSAAKSNPARSVALNDAFDIAEQHFPDFTGTYIMLPEHPRDTYKLYGSGDFIFYDQYAYGVSVNPWNAEAEILRSPETMSPLVTLSHIANPLHYGTIGGLWTKVIWFLFGILLSGMSLTGFLMWRGRLMKLSRQVNPTTTREGVQ